MQKRSLAAIRKPRVDDRPLWDVMFGIWGYPAILVAHELKFFELLAEKPLTLEEVCAAKKLAQRPAETLLAVCASLGLISLRGSRYSLTARSREYMLPSSPLYFGWFYDAWRLIISIWSPDSLREAVLTDKPQGVFSDPGGVFASWHSEHARDFTLAMHSMSIGAAMVWPRKVDLSRNQVMLDVGGGSGAHSIGAVTVRPKLKAIVLDLPPFAPSRRNSRRNTAFAIVSPRTALIFSRIRTRKPTCTSTGRSSTTGRPSDAASSHGRVLRVCRREDESSFTKCCSTMIGPGRSPSRHSTWTCLSECRGSSMRNAKCRRCSKRRAFAGSRRNRRSATGASSPE